MIVAGGLGRNSAAWLNSPTQIKNTARAELALFEVAEGEEAATLHIAADTIIFAVDSIAWCSTMTKLMEQALERIRKWPAERQDEVAEMLLALDEAGDYSEDLDAETLRAIDEAIAQAHRGEFADPAEIEAIFARYRK